MFENRPEARLYRPLLIGPVAVAFPTVAELRFGAVSRGWGEQRLADLEHALANVGVLMPDDAMIRVCGELRAEAARLGHPLAHRAHANDLWIATCAVYYEAPLLTGNHRHFKHFPYLKLLSPDTRP